MSIERLKEIWPEWNVAQELGEGSFGKVYKILRKEHGITSTAAVKVVSIPKSKKDLSDMFSEGMNEDEVRQYFQGMVADFVGEIQLMESMKGTAHIVSVEDYKVLERVDGIGWDIFIRMELLTPLNDYIGQRVLKEAEVVKLGQDICSALELCGKRSIIHRDIKPENIFVSSFGDFKIGDFGVARRLDESSNSLTQVGTYNYIAPEVAMSKQYDATVDIYSLGLVLYKLLNSNRLPFLDSRDQQIHYGSRKTAIERRFSGEVLPAPINASDQLAQVVLVACAYHPSQRFQSATAFKKALGAIVEKKPLPSPKGFSPRVADMDGTELVQWPSNEPPPVIREPSGRQPVTNQSKGRQPHQIQPNANQPYPGQSNTNRPYPRQSNTNRPYPGRPIAPGPSHQQGSSGSLASGGKGKRAGIIVAALVGVLLIGAFIIWQINPFGSSEPLEHTVAFFMNDGTDSLFGDRVTLNEGENIALPSLAPQREGYTFLYWTRDRWGNYRYNFDAPVREDLNLYAKWEVIVELPEEAGVNVVPELIPPDQVDEAGGEPEVVADPEPIVEEGISPDVEAGIHILVDNKLRGLSDASATNNASLLTRYINPNAAFYQESIDLISSYNRRNITVSIQNHVITDIRESNGRFFVDVTEYFIVVSSGSPGDHTQRVTYTVDNVGGELLISHLVIHEIDN